MFNSARTPQGSTITSLPGGARNPDMDVDYSEGMAVYCSQGGTFEVVPADHAQGGPTVTGSVPDAGWIPCRVREIVSNGTSASGFVGVY